MAVTVKSLMAAGVHYGEARCHRFMVQHVYGRRAGSCILNLDHSLSAVRRAASLLRDISAQGGSVLFLGTRPAIHKITHDAAVKADQYFSISWTGGTLTNRERVLRKSVGYDPDKVSQAIASAPSLDLADPDADLYTSPADSEPDSRKKGSKRSSKPAKSLQPHVPVPDCIVMLDPLNNMWAIREANQCKIPIIALCDSDMDPRLVSHPIPGNDDALVAVELIASELAEACRQGVRISIKTELRDRNIAADQEVADEDTFETNMY